MRWTGNTTVSDHCRRRSGRALLSTSGQTLWLVQPMLDLALGNDHSTTYARAPETASGDL
jgi:hypothetical protein